MEQNIKRPKDHRIRYSHEWALVNPGVMHLRLPRETAKAYIHVDPEGGFIGYSGFWNPTTLLFTSLERAMTWCENEVLKDIEFIEGQKLGAKYREQEMVDWFNSSGMIMD